MTDCPKTEYLDTTCKHRGDVGVAHVLTLLSRGSSVPLTCQVADVFEVSTLRMTNYKRVRLDPRAAVTLLRVHARLATKDLGCLVPVVQPALVTRKQRRRTANAIMSPWLD